MPKLHNYQKGLSLINYSPDFVCQHKYPDSVSSTNQLLDLIFAVDERTGLPQGCYAQYMSDKTSAEVKKFIEDTILNGAEPMSNLQDLQNKNLPSDLVSKFRDFKSDFLADMHRGRGETLEEYESRIAHFLRNEKTVAEYRAKYASKKDGKDAKDGN